MNLWSFITDKKKEKPAVFIRPQVRSYPLPYFERKYGRYFKDIVEYGNVVRAEIYKVNNSKEFSSSEKEFIINKKLRPILYKYNEDIEYGKTLFKEEV